MLGVLACYGADATRSSPAADMTNAVHFEEIAIRNQIANNESERHRTTSSGTRIASKVAAFLAK
jgi:hypothetical protein